MYRRRVRRPGVNFRKLFSRKYCSANFLAEQELNEWVTDGNSLHFVLAGNLFLLSRVFLCVARFCAYMLRNKKLLNTPLCLPEYCFHQSKYHLTSSVTGILLTFAKQIIERTKERTEEYTPMHSDTSEFVTTSIFQWVCLPYNQGKVSLLTNGQICCLRTDG